MMTATRPPAAFSRAAPPTPDDVLRLWRDAAAALYSLQDRLHAFAGAALSLPTDALPPDCELEDVADDANHALWFLSSFQSMLTDSMPGELRAAARRQARG